MSIPITLLTREGVELDAFQSQDGGSVIIEDNDGNVSLEVDNPTGSTLNLVIHRTNVLPDGDVAGPKTVPIEANSTVWCGPWPTSTFNDDANRVTFTPDAGLRLRGLRW